MSLSCTLDADGFQFPGILGFSPSVLVLVNGTTSAGVIARKVVGEGNNKTVVYEDDEPFSDSLIPYKSFKGELVITLLCFQLMLARRVRIRSMGDAIVAF